MKYIKKIIQVCFSIFFMSLCISCSDEIIQTPYIITELKSMICQKTPLYEISGIDFTFMNCSGKEIKDFYVSAHIYSQDKKNPFIGSNKINASFSGLIPANASHEYSISLDTFLHEIPRSEFLIDFFTITKITFNDGTKWTDAFGTFYTRSY